MAARLAPLAAFAACASALTVPRDQVFTPGAISLPVFQDVRIHPLERLRRRGLSDRAAKDTDTPVINVTSTTYLIELDIGSPGQDTKVAIDTGSSELWVNPNCARAGSSSQTSSCRANGQYDPSDSRTAFDLQQTGSIKYGKGQVALAYVADNITIPNSDIKISQATFGYATDSVDLERGILGLSFGENKNNTQYKTVVEEMKAQGVIDSVTMGIALGTKNEPTGSGLISFGGVDTKKFSGSLHTSPVLGPQNGENLWRYWVQMNSVGITLGSNNKKYSNSQFPVFFDTGATLSYLPSAIVDSLGSDLGGTLDSSSGMYVVLCDQSGSIDFTFGDFTIQVPMSEFLWYVGTDTRGRDACVIGADKGSDGSYLLGDSFLRSTYVVFDQETPALHFAPYVNCGTNLQKIPAGQNAAAKFSGECDPSSSNSGNSKNAAGRSASVGNVWAVAGALMVVQVVMSSL